MKLSMPITRSLGSALVFFELSVLFCLTTTHAQQATTPAQRQTTGTGAINLTATSANVGESGVAIRINILRWSNDEERNVLVAAMNPPPPPAPTPAGAAAGGRGSFARADGPEAAGLGQGRERG